MPRIEKIRLVGIRYDSMRKHYTDTTLDFMNGVEPAHTLLTLMNGGGKGLLLQMIFQLLSPLTKWGAKSENRIEALFYNERKQFQPYTFHIAIEWRLDTDPVKWLTTGIAVSAREKASASETDQESAEPRYLLYMLEQIKPGRYEIEDLPLYDQESRNAVSFEVWKEYLAARRSDFTIYTHNQTKDYFELLKSYDIDRKEWETMRDINRQEGGVEAYFRKGLDNHSLFHDLIIPEIGKHMAGTDEEGNPGTLFDIFKHNAAIAQHLPKLLKREDAYRFILQGLDPVIRILEQGTEMEREELEHGRIGSFIRQAMKEWLGEQDKEKERWEDERKRAEEEANELRWREDNLEYAEKHREVVRLREDLQACKARTERKEESAKQSKRLEAYAKAELLWNERRVFQSREESLRRELAVLQNANEHLNVRAELEQAESRLREEWSSVAGQWRETVDRIGWLQRQLEAVIRQAEQEKAVLQSSLEEKFKLQGGVTSQIQTLNTEKMDMERAFGRMVNEATEQLIAQLTKRREETDGKRKERERSLAEAEHEKVEIQNQLAVQQDRLVSMQETIAQAESALAKRRMLEKELGVSFAGFLKLERPGQPDATWFHDVQKTLSIELERLNEALARKQQELWTQQLDVSLAKNAFWIPNQELRKLKEELDSQGMKCHYGTEFMTALSEDERASHLKHFPLLPYGLVILDSEWKKRDAKRLGELLLRAPVPVFLRERMNGSGARIGEAEPLSGEAFRLMDGSLLLNDKGITLANDSRLWESWKNELLERNEDLQQQINFVQERLEQGREHERELNRLLSESDSRKLELDLEQIGIKRLEVERFIQEATAIKESVQQTIGGIESELAAIRTDIVDCSMKVEKLEVWAKRLEQGRKWQLQKSGLDKDIQGKQSEFADWSDREKSAREQLNAWKQANMAWINEQKKLLEQIKLLLGDVEFSFSSPNLGQMPSGDVSWTESELFTTDTGRLQELAATVKALTATMEEKSRQIGELNIHLVYAVKDITGKETELDRACPSWRQEAFADKPIELAQSGYDVALHVREEVDKELQNAKLQLSRLEGALDKEEKRIDQLDKSIRRKHGKAPDAWPEEDLNVLQADFDRQSESNRSHQAECRRLISELERTIRSLDTQLKILATQRISGELVYDIPQNIRQLVRIDAEKIVRDWVDKASKLRDSKQKLDSEVKEQRDRFLQTIRNEDIDDDLSGSLMLMLGEIRWEEYEAARDLLQSIQEHAEQELSSLSADKTKAEQARDVWTDRACYRVISIVKALKQMLNRMTFVNQGGHRYPLVTMDIRNGDLPEKPEDIRLLLRDYFVRAIDELGTQYADIASIPQAVLEDRMNDSRVVWTAFKNRYPTFRVYKPQTTNVFFYESPKKHHYTEWETLNKGSLTEAKGSGGQLLAARTIVMMMLMTYKRQIRESTQWSVLISDNPFGQAVSPHILDPIFAIAENLRFQWIVLAPPELIKLDVSRRFPVFWEMELLRDLHGESVTERLQHGGRTFEAEMDLFSFK